MASYAWFFYALTAAVLWGIGYVLSEKLLREGISPAFMMVVSASITLPLYLLLSVQLENFRENITHLFGNVKTLISIVMMALTVVGGNYFVLKSIDQKNATLASFVEISYPLFVFLFAWIFFKEVQLNWGTAFGALLIFCGITVIYLKS